jgi:hypothetical protein
VGRRHRRRRLHRDGGGTGLTRREPLKPGEALSGVAALTLFGLMFSTWFEHPTAAAIPASTIGFQTTPDAWHAFAVADWLLLAIIVCTLSASAVAAGGSKVRAPLDGAAVAVVLGLIAVGLIGYRVADPVTIHGVSYRRDLGLFLSLGAAGLIVIGGLWALRDRGTGLPRELARAAGGGSR